MSSVIPLWTSEAQFILVTVPIVIIMAYLPYVVRQIAILRMKRGFDNVNPRLFIASLENEALSGNPEPLFALRAHACHLNSIENIAFWVPAAIVGLLYSRVRLLVLCLAAIHVGLRAIYATIYLFTSNKALSYLRSIVWFMAWCCPLIILWEGVAALQ